MTLYQIYHVLLSHQCHHMFHWESEYSGTQHEAETATHKRLEDNTYARKAKQMLNLLLNSYSSVVQCDTDFFLLLLCVYTYQMSPCEIHMHMT